MRITLIGPGAIGCALGGALADKHDLTVCARVPFTRFVVRREGDPDRVAPAHVVTREADARPADWVLLCVKAHQTASAASWLAAAVGPSTKLAIFQNGVEHRERVAGLVPGTTTLVPVVIDLPAERIAPGEVVWNGPAYFAVTNDPAGRELVELFAGSFIRGETTDDLVTRAWTKLCLNVAGGAILALTDQTMGVMRKPGVLAVARKLIEECIAVGRAEGATLDDALAESVTDDLLRVAPERGNSMYFDRHAGHPTEWDARNGVIARLGKKHGIATPVSDALVPLLAALDP
jgi:2-dehydropantoate 2-reductase